MKLLRPKLLQTSKNTKAKFLILTLVDWLNFFMQSTTTGEMISDQEIQKHRFIN